MKMKLISGQLSNTFFTFATALALAAFVPATTPAEAAVTYGGSGPGNDAGEVLSAKVQFALTISGTTTGLVVTLTNTATNAPDDSADMLSGVFFDIAGNPSLSRVSGVLALGSTILDASTPTNGVIGGEWAYNNTINSSKVGHQGISAAGYGNTFASGDVFPGPALPNNGGTPPDGVGYSITTANDTGAFWNGGLQGRAFVQNSAVFTLGNVPASFSLANITNVSFQYGTTLSEPNSLAVLVPEPSSVTLTMAGIVLLTLLNRKRR